MTIMAASASYAPSSGDVLFLNKPTSQAGLGLGNVRVSGLNVLAVTFSNLTNASITPTAAQSYALVGIRGAANITATLTPSTVAAASTVEQSFSVTGLRVGEMVQVSKPTAQAGLDIAGARVVSNNVLGVTFMNPTAALITPTAAEGYTVLCLGGIDAADNHIIGEVNVGTVASIGGTNSATAVEVSFTLTGLATTDIIMGVQKPTAQAGLAVANGRAAAANVVGLNFITGGISVTATGSEVYSISFFRPNASAPLKLYSPTLTPVAVANGTTAEQSFTVTGLLSSTPAWVNAPQLQSGIGIVGVRVGASNSLSVTFSNTTSNTLTPSAGTYLVGNFQLTNPQVNGAIIQGFSMGDFQQGVLVNAMQSAMQSLGLISGV